MPLFRILPDVHTCCGCVTDLKAAAAIISVIAIVSKQIHERINDAIITELCFSKTFSLWKYNFYLATLLPEFKLNPVAK